jgi:hypothetical protein
LPIDLSGKKCLKRSLERRKIAHTRNPDVHKEKKTSEKE